MNLIKHSFKYFHSSIIRQSFNNIHNRLIYTNIPVINPQDVEKLLTEDITTTIELKGRNTRIPRRVIIKK
jgi:hypothetical protein